MTHKIKLPPHRNPRIAKAKKDIPSRWTRTKIYIRAHRKQVYLTLSYLASLGSMYLYFKRRDNELFKKYMKARNELFQREVELQIDDESLLSQQVDFLTEFVQKLYNDPDFHKYLKKKGYTELKLKNFKRPRHPALKK